MLTIAADAASRLKGWIPKTFGLMERFQLVRPTWLKLLRLLVTDGKKDRPFSIVTHLQELHMRPVAITEVGDV
jgi:hypothetical protein